MMHILAALILLSLSMSASAQPVDVTLATQPDGSRTLVHEIDVPAPVVEVWAAVTTTQGWQSWAVPLAREVPGSTDRFETSYDPAAAPGSPSTLEQQWIARRAPEVAEFRTTRTPNGFPHADAYRGVVSRFTLTPLGEESTRVRLEGAGYPPGTEGDALIAFFRKGNLDTLRNLHRRFVEGPVDWSKPTEPK